MIKKVDIDKRTYEFALKVIQFVKKLPKNMISFEIGKQLLRSGTSVAANVEEAQGAFSKNDFIYKMCISLKEVRESNLWLKLIRDSKISTTLKENEELLMESSEIKRILGKIITNSKCVKKS